MIIDRRRLIDKSKQSEIEKYKPQEVGALKVVKLDELLLKHGYIDQERLSKIHALQKSEKLKFNAAAVRSGLLSEDELVDVISKELRIPRFDRAKFKGLDPQLKQLIPESVARKELVIPIKKVDDTLIVAMADPLDIFLLDKLTMLTKSKIEVIVATESEIKEVIEEYYAKTSRMEALVRRVESSFKKEPTISELESVSDILEVRDDESATVIDIVNYLLIEALRAGASDIHIEPYEKQVRVRYRIDGVLYEIGSQIPRKLQNAMISRIKIMGKMDIAERRLPQDGRCKIMFDGNQVDLRISVMPTTFGEKAAIRLLNSKSLCIDLTELGFAPETLAIYEKNIQTPYGIILITGPTGSGKTTTLYSTLTKLNSPQKNIITIEDPVEYILPGINQVQVKPEIGLTFASGLRTFVRQDPDIIMVGEIRDRETAEMAINAALTGHLVLSTLHTNDAPSTITRLLNMGIEPFLVSSTLIMSVAQRLVRCICPNCKEDYTISSYALQALGLDVGEKRNIKLYKGRGCKECMEIGYRGRTGVFEVMTMNDEIRDAIVRRESAHRIKAMAIAAGMRPLREEAMTKVLQGITTIEEMLRITTIEES